MAYQSFINAGLTAAVFAALLLCSITVISEAKQTVAQARGTVVPSESMDNIILSKSAEETLVTVELKIYSRQYAAPRWILSASEIETLKGKLTNLPRSTRVDLPEWGYISVTNFNCSESFPYRTIYMVNNRLVMVDASGERSYYVDTKKAAEWLMQQAESHVPPSMYNRPVRSGSGVAMVISPPNENKKAVEPEVRNVNLMEYAPYIAVALLLILIVYLRLKRPKTESE